MPAPPVYGSPTGFGAGDTGFNSSNAKRKPRARVPNGGAAIVPPQETTTFIWCRRRRRKSHRVRRRPRHLRRPDLSATSRAAAGCGAAAAAGPAADQQSARRSASADRGGVAGAVLPIPPPLDVSSPASTPPPGTPLPGTLPLGAAPRSTLPFIGGDPYEPLGLRAGSFIILPAVELSPGFTTIRSTRRGGPGSTTYVVAPELHVRSDWARNSVTADITGSYYWYGNDSFQPSLNRPYLNSKIDGRLDVTRDTHILLENRFIVSTDNPGSPTSKPTSPRCRSIRRWAARSAWNSNSAVSTPRSRARSIARRIRRRTLSTAKAPTTMTAPTINMPASSAWAMRSIPASSRSWKSAKTSAITIGQVDVFGEDRSSTGTSAKLGGEFKLGGSMLVGEMSVGYLQRNYEDPTLPNISGLTMDGSLLWLATGLTSVKFTATSQVYEIDPARRVGHLQPRLQRRGRPRAAAPADCDRNVRLRARQLCRRSAPGRPLHAIAGLIYKLNPYVQLKGQVRYDWLASTQSGNAYQATSVLLTLRLQH